MCGEVGLIRRVSMVYWTQLETRPFGQTNTHTQWGYAPSSSSASAPGSFPASPTATRASGSAGPTSDSRGIREEEEETASGSREAGGMMLSSAAAAPPAPEICCSVRFRPPPLLPPLPLLLPLLLPVLTCRGGVRTLGS